jgi:hypothetical protein
MRVTHDDLDLRVNGIVFNTVTLQLRFAGGTLTTNKELVIEDNRLGRMTIAPNDIVELSEDGGNTWCPVALEQLMQVLLRQSSKD